MPSWRRVFTSEEARIESLAGASPCEDGPAALDAVEEGIRTGKCGSYAVEHGGDWPMPSPPPWPADDEEDEAPDE